jgi:aryl-alcohol dehydrogenase-like predicted oxidoreductase
LRRRRIGTLEVTVIGVGCNNFGRWLDAQQTRRIINAALDQGINFFDTADHYGRPRTASELLLGECLEARRDEAVIATKFGRALDRQRQGAKAAYVKSATEDALRRLRSDRIDLMQLHIPDPSTPIAETLGALSDLQAAGKIREFGASNFDATQLREAYDAAKGLGIRGFASTQAEYSLLHRDSERHILPECQRTGITLLPYLPLYNGLLSGRYRPGEPPPVGSRIAGKSESLQAFIFSERNMSIVADLTAYAEARGHTVLELAFAWLLSHDIIPSVIAGVSSPDQVAANAAAAEWVLSPTEIEEVERLARLPSGSRDA